MSSKKSTTPPMAVTASTTPISLTLDITEFHDVLESKYTLATLTPGTLGGGTIIVSGSAIACKAGCDLAITITSGIGVYIPVGVALIQVSNPMGSGNPNDPQGYTNFAKIAWQGTQLVFTNKFKHKGKKGKTAPIWKLYVMVADLGAQPPTLGVIDPEISNED